MEDKKLTYKDAGVDTKEGERAVSLMKEHVKGTFNENVLTGLGSFGSLFNLDVKGMTQPVLVSGTDGVGTKLKIAFLMDKHDTVGIDCVAMCINDVLCQGAKPLFFLDYIATGKVKAEKIADIVKGIADGCKQSGSALVGGETAEMPDFYSEGEYDMAGFSVGIVDRDRIITGEKVAVGNKIIGIPSSGIHSNGYSLVRKVFFDKMDMKVTDYVEELGQTLGEALLTPTKIYADACDAVLPKFDIKGIVHITGGGFFENIPRILPAGTAVSINVGSWDVPPIFPYIKKCGNIDRKEMFSTYNMGVGMMMVVDAADADAVVAALAAAGENASVIGEVVEMKDEKVILNYNELRSGKMSDKTKVAVLVSGGGTNLQALIDKIAAEELPEAEIVEVISSKEGAFALERAARAGIPTAVAKSQADVLAELKASGAEMIVLAGYMKVLSPEIIENYRNRIINIHPSLIPKYCGKGFYGIRVHQAVIAGGEKESGATVHYVDEGVDTGRIILQEKVPVLPGDTPEELAARVLVTEHRILAEGLRIAIAEMRK